MYARHDLAWLSGAGWQRVLAATPAGTPAHAALARWAGADWPLIVRRRDNARHNAGDAARRSVDQALGGGHAALGGGEHACDSAGEICLGLAAPPDPASGAKLRIPLHVLSRHIERHSAPLRLEAVVHALPPRWQAPFARLSKASERLDLRVFGSLALQALTGQPYLRDASDIDLLFRPRDAEELDEGALLLASLLDELPLDGEIVFPSGQAVAWKEWFTAGAGTGSERVLVKSQSDVKLGTRTELRAELEPA